MAALTAKGKKNGLQRRAGEEEEENWRQKLQLTAEGQAEAGTKISVSSPPFLSVFVSIPSSQSWLSSFLFISYLVPLSKRPTDRFARFVRPDAR